MVLAGGGSEGGREEEVLRAEGWADLRRKAGGEGGVGPARAGRPRAGRGEEGLRGYRWERAGEGVGERERERERGRQAGSEGGSETVGGCWSLARRARPRAPKRQARARSWPADPSRSHPGRRSPPIAPPSVFLAFAGGECRCEFEQAAGRAVTSAAHGCCCISLLPCTRPLAAAATQTPTTAASSTLLSSSPAAYPSL